MQNTTYNQPCPVEINKISDILKICGLILLGFLSIISYILGFFTKILHSACCKRKMKKNNECSRDENSTDSDKKNIDVHIDKI